MKYIVTQSKSAEGQGPNGDITLHSVQIAKTGAFYLDENGVKQQIPDKPIGWMPSGDKPIVVGTIIDRSDNDPYTRLPWINKKGQVIHLAVDKLEKKARKAVLTAGGYEAQSAAMIQKLAFDNVIGGHDE
jgi:hypothetical protein